MYLRVESSENVCDAHQEGCAMRMKGVCESFEQGCVKALSLQIISFAAVIKVISYQLSVIS